MPREMSSFIQLCAANARATWLREWQPDPMVRRVAREARIAVAQVDVLQDPLTKAMKKIGPGNLRLFVQDSSTFKLKKGEG